MQQPEDVQKPSRYHPRKSDDPRFQQKMEALSSAFVPVVFPPAKRLAIRENESLLKRLGLWDFVNIDFDEVLNLNLITELIVSFNNIKSNAKQNWCQLQGQRIFLNSQAIANALHLPSPKPGNSRRKKEVKGCSVSVSEEEGLFLEDFIWNFLLISDDGSRVYHLELDMIEFAESLKERRFDITKWAELVQFMVKKELLRGTRLTRCYYASHLHLLMKQQTEETQPELFGGHSGAAQSILTKCDDRRRDISDESDSKGKKIIIEEDDGGSKMEMETETVDVSCSSPESVNESVSRFIDFTHSKMEELQNINKMLHKQIEEQQKQLQEEQERYEFMLQIVEEQQKEFQEKQLQFQEQLGRAEVFEEDVIYQFAEMKISEERSVEEINGLKNLLSSVEKKAKETIGILRQQLALSELKEKEYCNVIEMLKQQLRFAEEKAKVAEMKVLDGQEIRRKLLETIQDLKGNIRVFCRVSPPAVLSDDDALKSKAISFPSTEELPGRGIEGIDVVNNGKKRSFTFDKVFRPDATQEDVFEEVSLLVESASNGSKVCIFSYGATGSGKTYTMMGGPGKEGLIPRAISQVLKDTQTLQGQGWKYDLQVSMLEFYKEMIQDLLLPNNTVKGLQKYEIRHDKGGLTSVEGLTVKSVGNEEEFAGLLRHALENRSSASTLMNQQSSRSHFVFTLKILGVNEGTKQQVQGVLNLVDLAGNERLCKTGAQGERLKEAQAINKGLLNLKCVISALGNGDEHVPFRNSKLTYLLEPCLSGNSKMLMFVNISGKSSSIGESLISLEFAASANACQIGGPRQAQSVQKKKTNETESSRRRKFH